MQAARDCLGYFHRLKRVASERAHIVVGGRTRDIGGALKDFDQLVDQNRLPCTGAPAHLGGVNLREALTINLEAREPGQLVDQHDLGRHHVLRQAAAEHGEHVPRQ